MITKSLILASLPLASLPLSTSLSSIAKADYSLPIQEQEEESNEGCTVMYVGKEASESGNPIIARSSDSSPYSMLLNVQVFEHNELAGKVVEGKNGFTWQMPDTTYRYISTPRNPVMRKGYHWEASGINENGVGVSATLSCATGDAARTADPAVREGITEDNITQIISAVATSARQGMEYLADIIEQKGSKDANIVLTVDQNEAWMMEMYTGHQYVAIKLPDDQACTIGNEFNLDTLEGIDPDDIIMSHDLMSLPMYPPSGQEAFAKWDKPENVGQLEHLDLFHTYAAELTGKTPSDHSHTRTWRGRNMFCRISKPEGWNKYDGTLKYPAFFTPDKPLTIDDVKLYMRDRYEDISDPNSEYKIDWFVEQEARHNLHYVANEGAYQVHIIEADKDLPKEMCCTEWLCLSASNYAPFVPINCANTKLIDLYTHQSEEFIYDEQAATCIYRALNRLADTNREHYGLITQKVLETYEDIWQWQYAKVIEKIVDLEEQDRLDILNNFTMHIQNQGINLSKQLYKFLLKHTIEDYRAGAPDPWTDFTALIDLEEYASMYGWSYQYDQETKIATLTRGDEEVIVDANYNLMKDGTITKGLFSDNIEVAIDNNRVYVDFEVAPDYLSYGYPLADINIDDYRTKPEPEPEEEKDPMKWMVPLATTMPIVGAGAGVGGTTFAFKFKKGKLLKIFKK